MNTSEFFDPYNIGHMKAFQHMQKTGAWPKEFFDKVKEQVHEDPHWYVTIQMKMANAWLKHSLSMDEIATKHRRLIK